MPLSKRPAHLYWFLAALLQAGVGCDQRDSTPPEKPEVLGEIMAIDSEGRPWRQGPEIKVQWPDDPRIDIAREFLSNHQYVQAEVILRTILGESPSIGRARMLLGITVQKQKRYAAALGILDEALATGQPFPEAAHGQHFRGWCLYHLGHSNEAQAAFEAHVQAFPKEGDSHFGLGIIALEAGDLDAAQERLEHAIELQASLPGRKREVAKAYARLGDVHFARGNLDVAKESYHTAVIRWSDHYEAWAKLARVLDRLDRSDEAERARVEYENALERSGRTVVKDAMP